MMIAHPMFDIPIEFVENKINVLVIENKRVFVKMISDLISQKEQGDGDFVLSKNFIPIPISKNMEIINNIFSINPNDKKILTGIYSQLEKEAFSSDFYINTNEQIINLKRYIKELVDTSNLNLTYNEEINISSLLKLTDVKIEYEEISLLDRVVEYMDVLMEYSRINCFVFVNIKAFFTDEEMISIYRHCFYKKINILLIESRYMDKKLEDEKIYILDEDLCFIY